MGSLWNLIALVRKFIVRPAETVRPIIILLLSIVSILKSQISSKVNGGTIFSGSNWGTRITRLNLRKEDFPLGRKRAETPVLT
jgi:hypothetical protein